MTETPLIDLTVTDVDQPPIEDAAPKATRRRRVTGDAKKGVPTIPAYRKGVIAKGFVNIYGSVGIGLMAFDPDCGQAVLKGAEQCAESLETLARDNPAVRRVLMSLISANAWSGVIIAHAPIILAIAQHHVPAVRTGMESLGTRLMGNFEDATDKRDSDFYVGTPG